MKRPGEKVGLERRENMGKTERLAHLGLHIILDCSLKFQQRSQASGGVCKPHKGTGLLSHTYTRCVGRDEYSLKTTK